VAWRPTPTQVWCAIEAYIEHAYDGPLPSAVRARMDTLRSLPPADFYNSPILEHDGARPPSRYLIHLGNRSYPHMRLVIARTADGHGCVFQVDSHDAHCRPEGDSREMRAFLHLVENNQRIAAAIEAAWIALGLPILRVPQSALAPAQPPNASSGAQSASR
jgi:hypothetical protein